ncbi:MAG TPA: vitamin B12 dependent-methionine synthase activation domain-containing protein, partial [Bacteroidota bacterium]|nr:vitamin B12 dependent-methionine synthase activation domain-containing protein [Bacteroidota bacterium]
IVGGAGGSVPTQTAEPNAEDQLTGAEAKIALALESQGAEPAVDVRSNVRNDVPIPRPPFWGTRVVDDISLDEVFGFVNDTALIRGQWRFVRGAMTEDEYKQALEARIMPDYRKLREQIKSEQLLVPKVVYGYFPCQSDGNSLVVYRPPEGNALTEEAVAASGRAPELARFTFPRQSGDRHLCIADYFSSVQSGKMDVFACQIVTVGKKASDHSKLLYDANRYKDYLYFHGLSVESAEALAELWHKRVREELGIAGKDAAQIKRLFSQGYQGSRFSFGYAACPRLEDQAKLFELLRPDRIGVFLTEEYQMDPEQSTSAIIVHHPEARYFTIT